MTDIDRVKRKLKKAAIAAMILTGISFGASGQNKSNKQDKNTHTEQSFDAFTSKHKSGIAGFEQNHKGSIDTLASKSKDDIADFEQAWKEKNPNHTTKTSSYEVGCSAEEMQAIKEQQNIESSAQEKASQAELEKWKAEHGYSSPSEAKPASNTQKPQVQNADNGEYMEISQDFMQTFADGMKLAKLPLSTRENVRDAYIEQLTANGYEKGGKFYGPENAIAKALVNGCKASGFNAEETEYFTTVTVIHLAEQGKIPSLTKNSPAKTVSQTGIMNLLNQAQIGD